MPFVKVRVQTQFIFSRPLHSDSTCGFSRSQSITASQAEQHHMIGKILLYYCIKRLSKLICLYDRLKMCAIQSLSCDCHSGVRSGGERVPQTVIMPRKCLTCHLQLTINHDLSEEFNHHSTTALIPLATDHKRFNWSG